MILPIWVGGEDDFGYYASQCSRSPHPNLQLFSNNFKKMDSRTHRQMSIRSEQSK